MISSNGANKFKLSRFDLYFLLVKPQNPISIIPDSEAVIQSSFSNLAELVEHKGFRQFYFKRKTEQDSEDGGGLVGRSGC